MVELQILPPPEEHKMWGLWRFPMERSSAKFCVAYREAQRIWAVFLEVKIYKTNPTVSR